MEAETWREQLGSQVKEVPHASLPPCLTCALRRLGDISHRTSSAPENVKQGFQGLCSIISKGAGRKQHASKQLALKQSPTPTSLPRVTAQCGGMETPTFLQRNELVMFCVHGVTKSDGLIQIMFLF